MSNLKRVTVSVCAATAMVLLALSLPALADDKCQADAQKLCPGTTAGSSDYAACMKKNSAQLSKGCARQIGHAQALANDVKDFPSCIADVNTLCPGSKPGTGKVMMCLRTHENDLSSDCKQELRDHGQLR